MRIKLLEKLIVRILVLNGVKAINEVLQCFILQSYIQASEASLAFHDLVINIVGGEL